MDGTLNEWNFSLPSYEALYEKGYFRNRPMQEEVLKAVACLEALKEENVFILSAVLADSEYALFEKHAWLDEHLPIPCRRRIFTICGEDKIGSVPAFNAETDVLIDDYGPNCKVWENAGGTYIKVARNEEDAEYEKGKHNYVIHPEMSCFEILKVMKEV